MDFTASASAGHDRAATTSPPAPPPRTRSGFFALDRSAMRALTERIGGDLARFYASLLAECSPSNRFRFPTASVNDIAEWTHDPPNAVRRRLIELERLGCIAWTRPTNQHHGAGELRLLVDLERVTRPAASDHRQRPTPAPPEVASAPVDNALSEPFETASPAVGLPVGLPETDRPTLGKCEQPETKTITSSPPDALGNGDTDSGGCSSPPPAVAEPGEALQAVDLEPAPCEVVNVAERTHRDHVTTIQKAAGLVVASRQASGYGAGGTGAHRHAAEQLETQLGDKCAEWLAAGCEPHRIAAAMADRFTGTKHGAVPWSPGDEPARLRTPPAADLEAEHVEPMTQADWERLPEALRESLAERCPTLAPEVVNR